MKIDKVYSFIPKKLIYIALSICTLLLLLALYFRQQNGRDTFVTSYEECNYKQNEFKDRYMCTATYSNIEQRGNFERCNELGGKVSCPVSGSMQGEDCDSKNRFCKLNFFQPELKLPLSYDECSSIGFIRGSSRGKHYCILTFTKDNPLDANKSESLFKSCLENGGTLKDDICEYTVMN